MTDTVLEKLKILAESAKYDVSCSSSGTVRHNTAGGIGNTVGGVGICHSFTADGRCVSLLKIMLTNHCIFDCAYCVNRRTNDRPRATLSVRELVDLTIEFYRRNYIEGLFLSSGIIRNPDYTMERMVRVVKELRTTHRFNGYIHLKSIPGCSRELVEEGGLYADRMSVNLELPTEESLRRVAPDKNFESVFAPMRYIRQGMLQSQEDRRKFRHAPRFVPAGQSTQIIVGATPETDRDILRVSSALYRRPSMRRVYYSGYVPVNTYDTRLPAAVGRALETMPDVEALPGVWASQRTDPGLLLSGVVTPEVPWDEAMAALDVPALLLTGDRPGSARVGREGLETAARNPRISPVLVPGAGHQVRRSDPEAFYRAVDEWLSELLPVG